MQSRKKTKKTRQIGHTYNRENEKIPIGHYIYWRTRTTLLIEYPSHKS